MAKIIALDVGLKRTGVAETDPLQIIATDVTTIDTAGLILFLKDYIARENPEALVIGEPRQMDGSPSTSHAFVMQVIVKISELWPGLPIHRVDERFTSKMAAQALAMSGMGKKKRQEKWRLDKISAVIILQSWLQSRS